MENEQNSAAQSKLTILNLGIMKWNMVRVVDSQPGVDGVIRVISGQISNGIVSKQSIVKIALLPSFEDKENDTNII